MTSAQQWSDFLRARVREDRAAAEGLYPLGRWQLTEAGATPLGVQGNGHLLATVDSGHGTWGNHALAMHLVRHQPARAAAHLEAIENLVDLLDFCINHSEVMTNEVLNVVLQFASVYHEHPDYPGTT